MGIQEYREILTLRKHEIATNNPAQLHSNPKKEEQVAEESSDEKEIPESATEKALGLLEDRPNLTADALPAIRVSSPPAVDNNNNVKIKSSESPVVSQYDKTKTKKDEPATESETAPIFETGPAVKRLIGMKEVMDRLGVSRPTIYNYLNPSSPSYNKDFPQPLMLNSENRWDESKINAFVETLNPSKKKQKQN